MCGQEGQEQVSRRSLRTQKEKSEIVYTVGRKVRVPAKKTGAKKKEENREKAKKRLQV